LQAPTKALVIESCTIITPVEKERKTH